LVIQHEDDAPEAWFGEWLDGAGVAMTVVRGHRGDPVPSSLSGYGGLLVMGGAMGAYDDARCPWLTPTKHLITTVVRVEQKPFLGICLGHQLAAVALDGVVERNPRGRALGMTQVRLTDAGRADPLLGGVGPGHRAVQWNDDIVTALPSGSSVLARAPDGTVQGARFGPQAWGVQFHPEVSPEVFACWGATETSNRAGIAAAAQEINGSASELRATWRPLAERFAAMVTTTAASEEASTSAPTSTSISFS
jgi:GMP synthase (glutamine-hydrolysing)